MAETHVTQPNPDTVLIAHLTVFLLDGTSFELYPFVDPNDVKSKVSDLMECWASSGFLLRGSRLIPWHQVRQLEASSVEEITCQEAHQRLMAWRAEDQRRAVDAFWKTKQERGPKSEDKHGNAEGDKDIQGH